MTRRRWIADEYSGNHAALTDAHAEHLVRVLRVRVGQDFDIATGNIVRRGRVTRVAAQRVEFELGEEIPAARTPKLTLLLAIFKFDRMEWAIEKCTELGAAGIIPVIASRTDVHLASAAGKRKERWKRIARQASEQSRRATAPWLQEPVKLKEGLKETASLRIVLAETEDETSLKEVLRARTDTNDLLLAIGPEGGWTADELSQFTKAGWISASLGRTILRAETAAIAATAVALSEMD
jgi:16S rRNA (uracil1498-N3)-methyltransferase